jgi:hypothetical protein
MNDTELRWQMRQLPREIEPGRDLWPEIGQRIASRRWSPRVLLPGLAIAASLLLAAGIAWQRQSAVAPAGDDGRLVRIQAQEISEEYQAALRQFQGAPISPEYDASLRSLDRSLVEIHRAIAADPHSVFLLEQLQKTYSRRLALTQRAVVG